MDDSNPQYQQRDRVQQKNLKMECGTLLSHVTNLQSSLTHLPSFGKDKPKLEMIKLPRTFEPNSNHFITSRLSSEAEGTMSEEEVENDNCESIDEAKVRRTQDEDLYIFVASTRYVASVQLISVRDDSSSSPNAECHDAKGNMISYGKPLNIYATPPSSVTKMGSEETGHQDGDVGREEKEVGLETLSSENVTVLVMESTGSELGREEEIFKVAAVIGTNKNRVLSAQLSILQHQSDCEMVDEFADSKYTYSLQKIQLADSIGVVGAGTGREADTDTRLGISCTTSYCLEPLPLDTEDSTNASILSKHASENSLNKSMENMSDTSSLPNYSGSVTFSLNNNTVNNKRIRRNNINNNNLNGEDGASVSVTSEIGSSSMVGGMSSKSKKKEKIIPFNPDGGVTSIRVYNKNNKCLSKMKSLSQNNSDSKLLDSVVWISYGDGTAVRLPDWAFFPLDPDDMESTNLETFWNRQHGNGSAVLRARVVLPPPSSTDSRDTINNKSSTTDHYSHNIVPLPEFFPTILSQPFQFNEIAQPFTLDEDNDDTFEDEHITDENEFYEALAYTNPAVTANSSTTSVPTMGFYTTENQLYSNTHLYSNPNANNADLQQGVGALFHAIKNRGSNLIGGTKALARGVIGGVMGAMWGQSHPPTTSQIRGHETQVQGMEIGMMDTEGAAGINDHNTIINTQYSTTAPDEIFNSTHATSTTTQPFAATSLFPQLRSDPISLPLSLAMFDSPRRFINISIDPEGVLAACADNLGRVQLVDLATKQVIRIWKGARDAACTWIQVPYNSSVMNVGLEVKPLLYLAIHVKQRKVVEVYRARHGPRVGLFPAEADDAQVVQCLVPGKSGKLYASSFLVQNDDNEKKYWLEELIITDETLDESQSRSCPSVLEAITNRENITGSSVVYSHKSGMSGVLDSSLSLEGTMQLQLLKQLLAIETHVPSDLDAVYVAFTQIAAVSDLNKALDLLAIAQHLEDGMGVEGSSFHTDVVAHAKDQLEILKTDEMIICSNNPHIPELASNIDFHCQLIAAFDAINYFEMGSFGGNNEDEKGEKNNAKTPWAAEAISWIETYEDVTGHAIDSELGHETGTLRFSSFAKACLQDSHGSKPRPKNDKGDQMLFLCDSTRDRKAILLHIFRPLVKDIFVFKTVNTVFECMGIRHDSDKLLTYYGEWFMSIPVMEAARASFFGLWNPTVRWIQDIVQDHLESGLYCSEGEDGENLLLSPLHKFCCQASDLPRAFLLAVVCCEAVSTMTKKFEEKTYGKVNSGDCVKPWEDLLRKLRTCLLFSLRLDGVPLGPFPITVENIENGKIFSIYEWIARDELFFSHKQEEIKNLENSYRSSLEVFHPSSHEGDKSSKWQMIQKSCKTFAMNTKKKSRPKFAMRSEIQPKPLLLYFSQYNNPILLATHRALLLANMWSREPKSLHLMKDAMSALKSIEGVNKYNSLADAVLVEIWDVCLRPVYRAILFGFDDVHELREEIVAPLCMDNGWLRSLSRISLDLFSLLEHTGCSVENMINDNIRLEQMSVSEGWPALQEDFTTQCIQQKFRPVQKTSLDIHRGAICSVQINNDLSILHMCFPSFEDIFLRGVLFQEFSANFSANDYQVHFINSSLRQQAALADGPVVDPFVLDEIMNLGRTWAISKSQILTEFLLAMYEIGKDNMVDDLANTSAQQLDTPVFVAGVIEIACIRLNAAVFLLKKTKQYRGIIGMLDADTCQWMKERAEAALEMRPGMNDIGFDGELRSLANTHTLVLRIMRLQTGNRGEAHALSILSGTLLNALKEFEQ